MRSDNKMKSKAAHKKDGSHSKHIKHDPNAESARAIFGLQNSAKNNKD